MLELRILTTLIDWKRCSQALSRHHSYHPRFEVQISLHHVGLGDQLEDEDDDDDWRSKFCCSAKYSAQRQLSLSKNVWTSGSSVCFLTGPCFQWNIRYSWSFSILMSHKSSGCFFVSRALTQWSCLIVGV